MIRYPKVQKQLRAELNSQLQNKSFEMINKQKLPYLHATIDELQRIVNILPWHIPHAINTDVSCFFLFIKLIKVFTIFLLKKFFKY